MRLDTVFKLASSSKLLTTIAVLQGVERGLLNLNDDVGIYLPTLASQRILTGFTWYGKPKTKPRQKTITLHHLLTQTAGVGYDFLEIQPLWRYQWWHGYPIAKGDHVEERLNYPLLHEPGEGWSYGGSITWAGKYLEKISGITLEQWIQRYICKPLGLTSVTFFPNDDPAILSKLAAMSYRNPKTGKVEYLAGSNQPECQEERLGGEGIYANLEDLLSILHSLLVDDQRLLRKETAAMMFTPQLNSLERKNLRECLQHPRWICKTILKKDEYDWGLGGVLVDGDGHEYLKPGTLLWSGLFHNLWVCFQGCCCCCLSHFHPPQCGSSSTMMLTGFFFLLQWIDRKGGVCGVFGAQVYPATDKIAIPLMRSFQEEVYRKLKDNEYAHDERG